MAKRFTETEKWQDKFFRSLDNDHKLLWLFLLDNCNHAGIWEIDWELVEFRLKVAFDEKSVLQKFGDKIHQFDNNNKWFIKPFIKFQYKELNPTVKAHYSVIEKLKEHDLEKEIDNFVY